MALVENTLVGGASALGGWLVLRRLHRWDPDGDRAGEVVARAGIGAADLLGGIVEGTGHIIANAIRGSGELTAKTAGVTVATAGGVVYRVVPGLGSSDAEAEKPEVETAAPAKTGAKKPAKKTQAKKSGKTK